MSTDTVLGPCQDLLLAGRRLVVGPYRARRVQLYGVGAPKTGTHSVAAMFRGSVRARHHAEAAELIEHILDWRGGRLDARAMARWLVERDRHLALEVDSAPLNMEILDFLLQEFPDARFLLTVRDCTSWLNSFANHLLRSRGRRRDVWPRLQDHRFRAEVLRHAPEERAWQERGLHTLDGYLSYWARHQQTVLDRVPAARLLVVPVDQLGPRAPEIADFAGLPRRTLRLDRTHACRNDGKDDLLALLDRDFLQAKVAQHCGPLMQRLFPGIRTLDDAPL